MDNDYPVWTLAGICLLVCCAIMALAWLWAYKVKNAGIASIFWAYNFPVIAIILYLTGPGHETRRILICGMIILAGLRLGTHLAFRVLEHINEEDGRYKQLRSKWASDAGRKFFFLFQFQAISNVILAIPFFIAVMNPAYDVSGFEWTGLGLWFISILGEAIADKQLTAFKKDPANKGLVCQSGLWYYSRHPNYFFQWLMWMAYFIFALGSPWGWVAVISPAIMLYLLLKVTGIPVVEEQLLRSKGEAFRQYQRATSVFVPWGKKR